MRERIEWTAAETAPAGAEALRLQGLPADLPPSPRTAGLLERAQAEYLRLAAPRGLFAEIEREAFTRVYDGAGRNAPHGPLEVIAPRAERLALFVATVGSDLTTAIRGLFDRNDAPLAVMLDAVASAAADRLAERIAARFLARAGADGAGHLRVLAYSPGYCGWHVTGQRALFERLEPEEIGVSLNPSCLMDPLKSVSGVLVAGAGVIHRFAPEWPFCDDCADRPCRARIASVLSS
ncbi:MAG TPA: vitamin B12 dependent-methionine synthase activation domain-containing protein [Candidatus Eisenbacteria bacterium]